MVNSRKQTSYIPQTFQEALQLKREFGAVPIAGGTDILVRYRSISGTQPAFPWPVMYIGNLEELQGIEKKADSIVINAGTILADVESSVLVPSILRKAVRQMAAPALRNIGTLAGNICNASPAGDALCVLYALHADVELRSEQKSRILPISEFVTGPGKTLLADDELLYAVHIPNNDFTIEFYRKVGTRKANALTKLSCVGLLKHEDGMIRNFRLAFGAVGPTIVCSEKIEARLSGISYEVFGSIKEEIENNYAELIIPIDDQRSTADYRKETSILLLQKFLEQIQEALNI